MHLEQTKVSAEQSVTFGQTMGLSGGTVGSLAAGITAIHDGSRIARSVAVSAAEKKVAPSSVSAWLRAALCVIGAASCLAAAPARARAAEPPRANDSATPGELVWRDDWKRFRTAEFVLVPVLGAAMLTTGLAAPGKTNPTWLGRNDFDDGARAAFAGRTAATRKVASTASDVLYVSLTLYPAVVESLVLAGIVHKSKDVAFQLFMIYGEAALTSGLVTVATQGLAYRGRPLVLGCREDDGYDAICGTKHESRSFLAGHVSMAFNSAALTCVNQAHLPLYGSRSGGLAACVTTLTAATATGFFRLIGDKHWASDVLAGAGLGTATGLLYPLLLHYGVGDARLGGGTLAVTPVVADGTAGVAVGWTQ